MNFSNFNIQTPVGDFVNHNPVVAIKLLGDFDLDYCCGGKKTLKQACEEKELNATEVLNQLNQAEFESKTRINDDWLALDPVSLIDQIVNTHHCYLEKVFPELIQTTEKVVQAHGNNHKELRELRKTIHALIDDFQPHLIKEEQVLFPMIKTISESIDSNPMANLGSLEKPIRVMLSEHENVGHLLQQIKSLTNGYSPPNDACNSFKHLYRILKEIEQDTFLHIHKENNLLFPKVLELVT